MPRATGSPVGETPFKLENPSRIVVIGAGPAGSFFAMQALERARCLGHDVELLLIEQKKPSAPCDASCTGSQREGCNYCAGGVSPRLADTLEEAGIGVPEKVIQSEVRSLTIQGNWKHIEIKVPEGRKMFSVFRGSRPVVRSRRDDNFDSLLLQHCIGLGAKVETGVAMSLSRSETGKLIVRHRAGHEETGRHRETEADFVVLAGGVNQTLGRSPEENELLRSLTSLLPGFVPPKVRRALICEVQADRDLVRSIQGEMYFVEYGSKDLKIEMSSIVPKGEGLVTLTLLGPSVDHAAPSDGIRIIRSFLDLPQVKRLLPPKALFEPVCTCFPNMTVGVVARACGDRIAVIGDAAVSRLYKDGIMSAHVTASALVKCMFEHGIDYKSLRDHYGPAVRAVKRDNAFGKFVFFSNRVAFGHPILSRILYQAVLTERKNRRRGDRELEQILWWIASGDASYARILRRMLGLSSLTAILYGGALITLRNYCTELLFGLRWGDVGRYPTGVYREVVEQKREIYLEKAILAPPAPAFDFERLYSIKIKAPKERIFDQLGRFGEDSMAYFRPRNVTIQKLKGGGNSPGKLIRYVTPVPFLNFSIVLEAVLEDRYIVYRVRNGFARGGCLVFDVEEGTSSCDLSIYVAFNFPRGEALMEKLYWSIFRRLFPQFVHDVLWNYSLCQLKDIVEGE